MHNCAIQFAEFYDLFYGKPEKNSYEKALNIININGMIPMNDENIVNLNNGLSNMNYIHNDLTKYIGEILNNRLSNTSEL